MDKIVRIIDLIVTKFWMFFCLVIFCGSLVIKAKYHMADYPYFTYNSVIDISLLFLMIGILLLLYKYADKIEKKITYPMLYFVFGIIGIAFVLFVPIKPFSDMSYVTEGALLFAERNIEGILASEYLQIITKNLKVAMFYGFFGQLFPKNLISFRIINVFLYLLTAHFLSKIGKNLGYRYTKIIFIISAGYLPMILYCNHIYFDLPVLCLCTISVYFYTKEKKCKNMIASALALGFACSLRVLAYLFLIAIAMDFVFFYKKKLLHTERKKIMMLLLFVLIVGGIPKTCDTLVNHCFRVEGSEDESIWTLFWMGINEEEFGFMHNEIADGTKSFSDFYTLLVSRNAEQNVKLFGRKIFWEWSQGTYQAQRYGFSLDALNVTDKFEYETPITKYLMYDDQQGRQLINSFCRAQYLSLFFFMILGLWKMDAFERSKYRMLIYLMFGTFLILIFYEMKSRYVMHCMISMIMLAMRGMENLSNKNI